MGSKPAERTSIGMDKSHLIEKEGDVRLKFDRACQQIALLDQKIRDLEIRYKRAVKHKKNSFRYNLRLRMSVVTGVKMMYHHYASTKAEELSRIRRQIRNASALSSSESNLRAATITRLLGNE